ncbi:hypothetical protein [Nocardia nepalensis]|uniref:hypothetical protein n=1 Tax=Nocardia nepalensis TaxID=3375448 RepID=UPI003B67C9DC
MCALPSRSLERVHGMSVALADHVGIARCQRGAGVVRHTTASWRNKAAGFAVADRVRAAHATQEVP